MNLPPAIQLLGLLLLTAFLGGVIGGCIVRLFALKRLQKHYEQWRLGVHKALRAMPELRRERDELSALAERRARSIADLENRLVDLTQQHEDVPILTRRVDLGKPDVVDRATSRRTAESRSASGSREIARPHTADSREAARSLDTSDSRATPESRETAEAVGPG